MKRRLQISNTDANSHDDADGNEFELLLSIYANFFQASISLCSVPV